MHATSTARGARRRVARVHGPARVPAGLDEPRLAAVFQDHMFMQPLLIALGAAMQLRVADAGGAIPTWTPFEAEMLSLKSRPNSTRLWADIDVNVTFSTGQLTMVMPAFWDGGNTWRVRFSPTKPGSWEYISSCSDRADAGLHGVKGKFDASTYSGTNPLFQHGVLVPSTNNRYLQHADGTPFYWLGDTHWSGFSSAEHFDDTNNNSFDSSGSMFKEMVRKPQHR